MKTVQKHIETFETASNTNILTLPIPAKFCHKNAKLLRIVLSFKSAHSETTTNTAFFNDT